MKLSTKIISEKLTGVGRNIGVVGLGCIGASIAMALRNNGNYNIIGVDKDIDTLKIAFEKNIIQLGHSDMGILKGCEIVFVCTPVETVSKVIDEVYKVLGTSAIVTDVASVKRPIINALPQGIRFVGGHPMAGSERGGIAAAGKNMFQNAYYVITKAQSAEEDVEKINALVRDMDALPINLDADTHDTAVAKISHLPHMIAYTLVNNSIDDETSRVLAAGGFRDITRIASSSPKMWLNIIKLNKNNILTQLDKMIFGLKNLADEIEADDYMSIEQKLSMAQSKRADIDKDLGRNYFYIRVDVFDVPGIIAKITTLLYKKGINLKNINIENSREGEGGALMLNFENFREFTLAAELLKQKKYRIKTE